MHRITPGAPAALFDTAATRRLEQRAAALLPAHTLMQRAGLAIARLARALAPHARTVWIACGTGNNGGDGIEAALHLHQHGLQVTVTWLGTPETAPPDTLRAWQAASAAGVPFSSQAPSHLGPYDLCIDALLGVGLAPDDTRTAPAAHSPVLTLLQQLRQSAAPVLAVDVPTGLQADTGQYATGFAPDPASPPQAARHTLTLLTLKSGLFTGMGRDAAGTVWFDDLGCPPDAERPSAWLLGQPALSPRAHASHKGSYGDVAVIGGEGLAERGMGMTGAALLAARAALHSGAGRVLVCLLDGGGLALDLQQPELMFRHFQVLPLEQLTVVCGCGGGEAVVAALPEVLQRAHRLVLDADALNAIAADSALQSALRARAVRKQGTVLTPHPLEAARLLGTDTARVQADRLTATQQLAEHLACMVVLKGSGSVVAAPDQAPCINPTGNARLATAGTGDVLAGMVGARLAAGVGALQAATSAVFVHGWTADHWPSDQFLTADRLARHLIFE